jgi:hypothetical protein
MLKISILILLTAASLSGGVFGCAAAAVGAGAGTAGAVAYTDRGAKGEVKGNLGDIDDHTRSTFKQMGIALTGSAMRYSGDEQDLTGKYGGTDVAVQMTKSTPDVTHVEVIARQSTLSWNKDYAKEILNKIVAES